MESAFSQLTESIYKGWKSGNKIIQGFIITIIALIISTITVLIFSQIGDNDEGFLKSIASVLGGSAFIIGIGINSYQNSLRKEQEELKVKDLESKIKENPSETQSAWELAQIKLESYLNKNLRQVSSIFYLTLFVMFIGFGLILFGVYKAFENPDLLNPSILVSSSGLIVNFIGASFLIIYKSTMQQAKEYVVVLERINAVGMSLQILETINDQANNLKDNTTAEIAKELLKMYGQKELRKN